MRVTMATEPASSGQENEDFVAAIPHAVVLLDGAGLSGTDSGCIHGVAWYARQLGSSLIARLAGASGDALSDVLADAIKTVTESHAGTCDVHHVGTPSATVIIVRAESGMLDYLVLADSILVLHYADDRNDVICDNREAEVARPYRPAMTSTTHGTPEHAEGRRSFMNVIREHRNTPGGFWVASSDPAAAHEAFTGHCPIDELESVTLLSDGASRLVDRFGRSTWEQTIDTLRREGPAALISAVRAAERSDPEGSRWPRGKTYDDATAAYCTEF